MAHVGFLWTEVSCKLHLQSVQCTSSFAVLGPSSDHSVLGRYGAVVFITTTILTAYCNLSVALCSDMSHIYGVFGEARYGSSACLEVLPRSIT